MNHSERLYYLLGRYIDNSATPSELEELGTLLNQQPEDEAAKEYLFKWLGQTEPYPVSDEARWQAIRERIGQPVEHTDQPAKLRRLENHRRWWAAAAVLIVIGAAAYFLAMQSPSKEIVATAVHQPLENDLPPGGDRAILTLSDGSSIILDSAHNGRLASQGNTRILKLNNNEVAYEAPGRKTASVLFNTLSTPRGGQYRLTLPDGTKVWLNAASSITYPTAFTGGTREVSATGEVYFEVAPDALMPFHVKVKDMEVEVLGTHFNLNAYDDEHLIRTTLLEGRVKLVNDRASTDLRPGQQGQVSPEGNMQVEDHADIEKVMAWKNGLFDFEDADIQTVMRQLARWYNVDVVYKGNIGTEKFVGEIPRSSNISEVFKILELSDVHFKLEGNKVTVMP